MIARLIVEPGYKALQTTDGRDKLRSFFFKLSSTFSADWNSDTLQQYFPDKPSVRDMFDRNIVPKLTFEDWPPVHKSVQPAESMKKKPNGGITKTIFKKDKDQPRDSRMRTRSKSHR